jgi:LmeA-like phospholipid-binding
VPLPDDPPILQLAEPPDEEAPSAADLLIGLLDGTLSTVARRPVKVRAKVSPVAAMLGSIDVVVFELGELEMAGLEVERIVVRAENVRIQPGFPPRLRTGEIGFKATVAQQAIDRWTQRTHLPVRLHLTEEGVIVKTSVRGFSISEVATELAVSGHFLTLRPKRASFVGLPAPAIGLLRGFLPLPPLPRGARLSKVEHEDGHVTAWFALDDIDQPLTPAIARRLRPSLLPRFRF